VVWSITMTLNPLLAAVIFLLVLAVIIEAFIYMWPRKRWYPENGLSSYFERRRCTRCSGGMQSLGDDGWGKIPKSHLMLDRDGGDDLHRAPLANTRNCPCCNGSGYHLVETGLPYTESPSNAIETRRPR
jgi:hypothetical protein